MSERGTIEAMELMPPATGLLRASANWFFSRDADLRARALFHRHYSRRAYADGRDPKHFVGPGQKCVLVTWNYDALFVWRKFISGNGQKGVNCAVFRNEGPVRSSELILEAEQVACKRWPGERLYTYVNASKIRSDNPGCCFKKAGWRKCGETRRHKLLIFEKHQQPKEQP